MLRCRECGAMLREKANFCTQCGQAQEIVQYPPLDAPSYTRPQAPWEVPNNAQQADETLLNPEMRRLLLECIRNNRFNQLDEIVKELSGDLARYRKLSAALTHVLFDQTLKELQPPHGSFGHYDEPHKFQRAKELINSKDELKRKEGLELFKQMRSNKNFSSHPLVYKWTLFAEAAVHGLIQAVAEWEKRRVAGDASSEEIWNLAVFNVGKLDFKQALDVLRSDIDKNKAPFVHLRFALYCAAQLLGQSQPTSDTWNTARDFLSQNLHKWPAPESYLAWMALEREKQPEQSIDIEHIKRWKTLYNLLDQPVAIPNLVNRPDNEQARIFVERLEQLDLIETLILWLNNYTKRYCAQFGNKERPSSKFEELDFEMWQKLSKAYECAKDTEQAGNILFHLALQQQKIFIRQRENSANIPGAAFQYMRERLMKLFQFYQRNKLLPDNTTFDRFEIFYKKVPELWDDKERRNRDLIQITRPLLERGHRPKQEATIPPQPAQKLSSPPRLCVENASSDLSLSRKNGETTLSISVHNPGPGKVTKISITCSKTEKPILAFKDKVCLDSLEQDEKRFVAVPVIISSPTSEEQLKFRVDLTFQWERDAEKRAISAWLAVKLADFHHLSNPYTFDRPIGSSSQDAQLFQGREQELALNHQDKVTSKRVGIFVDFENALPSAGGMSGQEMGEALINYYSQFGEIVCRLVSADQRNSKNGGHSQLTGFEQASFRVHFPPNGKALKEKDKADFVLVDLTHKEKLDIYIIVSGDGHYSVRINSLIESGAMVRLCASRSRLANEYVILQEERRQHRQVDGLTSDFFIDDLDAVLQGKYPGTN